MTALLTLLSETAKMALYMLGEIAKQAGDAFGVDAATAAFVTIASKFVVRWNDKQRPLAGTATW